jgi:translocation and assembly module TamA
MFLNSKFFRWAMPALNAAALCTLVACAGKTTHAQTANYVATPDPATAGSVESAAIPAAKPDQAGIPSNVKRTNRVFTTVSGIDDRAIRVNALSAIELRGLKRKQSASEAQIRRLYKRAPKQIMVALEPFGYYQAKITPTLALVGEKFLANFAVDLGPRTRIKSVNFKLDGPAELDLSVTKAWRKIALKAGDPLDHTRYEAAKNEVQRVLLQRGYLDAELIDHRIDVSRTNATASVFLTWKTGVRYALGETKFSGGQFSDEFLARYVSYDVGDLYTQTRLLNLQQRLVDADYFSVVEISPETDAAANGIVPISVELVPAKRSIYTYGVSFGTDSGAGVKGGLERRWVNDRGHKFRSGAEVSQRLKVLAASYEIPLPDKARTTYALNLSYRDQQTDTSRAKLTKLGIARSREWKGWQQTYALSWLRGDFEIGGELGASTLLYPEIILYKREADDLLYPREGYAATINARAGAKGVLSDTSFANASIDARYIHSLADNQRLLARGTLGAVYAQDFNALPPELRFFAGGDRSIRGYNYQELGPLNGLNKVRGGKYLAVLSGEYEYAFNDTWALAGFADVGNAFDSSAVSASGDSSSGAGGGSINTNSSIKKSVGAGLRWRSPVGIVRIDFAFAIDEPASPLKLHLVIGPDL